MVDESFSVPPFEDVQRSATLAEGDVVHIGFEVTSGGNRDIDFFVQNDTTTFIADTRVTTMNRDWTVLSNATYYFIYDNSFSWFIPKDVTTKLTRHWTETDYRDVTKYHPLLSYEFSYVGLVLSLARIGITVLGFLRKELSETVK